MNNLDLKNIIVLKELPSNIIDEAIVILKDNKNKEKNIVNIKRDEYINSNIVNEAQNIIVKYINKMEENKINKNKENKLILKYKRLQKLSIALGLMLIINFVITIIK